VLNLTLPSSSAVKLNPDKLKDIPSSEIPPILTNIGFSFEENLKLSFIPSVMRASHSVELFFLKNQNPSVT